MGYFNVVKPCVITGADGKVRHYSRPTEQPIELDDAVAAPLVADGSLEPYKPGVVAVALPVPAEAAASAESETPKPRAKPRRDSEPAES